METATYVKICCPRCGGKDLNIIGDRDIGGSVVSGMGVSAFAGTEAGVIAGASGLQQKTYWICKKCGRKFRNPDELMAEVEAYQKRAKGFKIVGIIMSVLLLVAAAGMLINGIGIMALFFLILDAPFILCMRVSAYQVQSRKQELNEIMEGMQRMWQSESK